MWRKSRALDIMFTFFGIYAGSPKAHDLQVSGKGMIPQKQGKTVFR
jgi:hypothetical protein